MPQNIQNEGQLRKNPLSEPAPTAKPDYRKYLEIIGKVLALSATLGLIIGCFMAFTYLKNINFISVFPDVIKDSSSLIAVLVVIGVLISWLGMSFFSPYLLLCYLSSVKDYTIRKFFRTKSLLIILYFIVLIYFAILITAFMEWIWITHTRTLTFIILLLPTIKSISSTIILSLPVIKSFLPVIKSFLPVIIFLLPVIIAIITLFWIWNRKQQNKNNQIIWKDFRRILIESVPFILLILFIYSTTFSTLWFLLQLLDGIDDDIWQYVLLFGYGVLLIWNNWIFASYLRSYSKNKNKNNTNVIIFSVIIPFILTMLLLIGFSAFAHNFPSYVFTIIRFTEKPNNSSWYLLHNNFQKNDGTQEVNGIEKADLLRLKEKFQCPKDQEEQKKCSNLPYQRNNALYGYMAWNLGNTKVFCPASVSNYRNAKCQDKNKDEKCDEEEQNDANKTAFSQCLVIDGKFLQMMDEQYIGMPEKENNVSNENLQTERPIDNLPSDIKIRQ